MVDTLSIPVARVGSLIFHRRGPSVVSFQEESVYETRISVSKEAVKQLFSQWRLPGLSVTPPP